MRITEIDKKEEFVAKIDGSFEDKLKQENKRLTVENTALREICAAWSISFNKLRAHAKVKDAGQYLPGELFPDLPEVK